MTTPDDARAPLSAKNAWRLAWERLSGGELTPSRAALSVAVGLAIGVTPLYGLHALLVLAVCVPLRLDARVGFLASNISLPFIAPFLALAEIQIGAGLRTGHFLALDREALHAHGLAAFTGDLVIGTAIVAPAMAALGGSLTLAIASLRAWRRRSKTPA